MGEREEVARGRDMSAVRAADGVGGRQRAGADGDGRIAAGTRERAGPEPPRDALAPLLVGSALLHDRSRGDRLGAVDATVQAHTGSLRGRGQWLRTRNDADALAAAVASVTRQAPGRSGTPASRGPTRTA